MLRGLGFPMSSGNLTKGLNKEGKKVLPFKNIVTDSYKIDLLHNNSIKWVRWELSSLF